MPLTKVKSSSIAANAITAINIAPGTTANLLTAGNNITIEANGRINSTLFAGDNLTIAANGRISSTASTSTDEIDGFLLAGM